MSAIFTGTGATPWVRNNGQAFSIVAKQTDGTGAVWIVVLELSHDKVQADPILTHTETTPGNGVPFYTGASNFKAPWRRARVASLSGGTIQVDHDG